MYIVSLQRFACGLLPLQNGAHRLTEMPQIARKCVRRYEGTKVPSKVPSKLQFKNRDKSQEGKLHVQPMRFGTFVIVQEEMTGRDQGLKTSRFFRVTVFPGHSPNGPRTHNDENITEIRIKFDLYVCVVYVTSETFTNQSSKDNKVRYHIYWIDYLSSFVSSLLG